MSSIPYKLMDNVRFDRYFRVDYNQNWKESWRQHLLQKYRVDELLRDGTGEFGEMIASRVGADGTVHKTLVDRLDAEFNHLLRKVDRVVHIDDYIPDGATPIDYTQYFHEAMGTGNVHLILGEGTYRASGLKVPSNTKISGAGKMSTTLKLTDDAPLNANLITNANHSTGDRNIHIEDLFLDWNRERPGGDKPLLTGNPDGCNIIFINTQYVWINGVKAVNAARHNFDVSASIYHKAGDNPEVYEPDGCKYVWMTGCEAFGSGDDNFTTHFSEYIWIDRCTGLDPAGILFTGAITNANNFEIDDGSRHVWVTNCYSRGGSRGFESKAHNHSPAPYDVKFINCVSEEAIRAFDVRHNGFTLRSQPKSKSAYNVEFIGCTAINPVRKSFYASLSPRALAIAAYSHVNVTNFTAIGGEDEVTGEVISLYQNSSFINLNTVTIRGFKKARTDIRLVGETSRSKGTSNVNMTNILIENSALRAIGVGRKIETCSIVNVMARGEGRPGSIGIASAMSRINLINADFQGYEFASKIARNGRSKANQFRSALGMVLASTRANVMHENAAVIASTGFSVASGYKSVVLASSSSEASGERSAVMASGGQSKALAAYSVVIGSRSSTSSAARGVTLASFNVINPQANAVAGGWNPDGPQSSANRNWQLNSGNGNITAKGSVTGGSHYSDFAEYFESKDGKAIPTGTIVTLEKDKVVVAQEGDYMLGVVSETAAVILGESSFHWRGRYLLNEFGGYIYEYKEDEEGNRVKVPKESPSYVDTGDYRPRSDREEWNVVGMLGQIYTRIDDTVSVGDTIVPRSGIGTRGDSSWRVMRISTPYRSDKGYGVAFVAIK